jgi:hypothetical protein
MNRSIHITIGIASFFIAMSPVLVSQAAELIIYPANDQSEAQQIADDMACVDWARNKTGFDPAFPPPAHPGQAQPSASQKKAGRKQRRRKFLAGAAVGAAAGEIIHNDPGEGALVGAATVGVFGGINRRQAKKQQDQAHQAMMIQYLANSDRYSSYYSACMEGRGYVVR